MALSKNEYVALVLAFPYCSGNFLWKPQSATQGRAEYVSALLTASPAPKAAVAQSVVTRHLDPFMCRKPGRFCLRTSWNALHLVLTRPGSWSHLAIQKPAAPEEPCASPRTPASPGSGLFCSLSGPSFKTIRQKVQVLPHLLPFNLPWALSP